MSEVNREAIREWVTALRSGVYTQGRGQLHGIVETPEGSENRYCCLGVACEVFKDRIDLPVYIASTGYVRYGEAVTGSFMPAELVSYLGLESDDPILMRNIGAARAVSALNDVEQLDFNQIADAIERTYLTCDYNTGYGLPGVAKCGKPAVGKWHETDDEWFCAEHMNPQDGE